MNPGQYQAKNILIFIRSWIFFQKSKTQYIIFVYIIVDFLRVQRRVFSLLYQIMNVLRYDDFYLNSPKSFSLKFSIFVDFFVMLLLYS